MRFPTPRKWSDLLLCLSALFLLLTGCGGGGDEPPSVNEQPLVVGMELAYRPFEMTDAANEPAGISVDLARALGEKLGRPVRIENIPFDGLIASLRTGKVDVVISSMTATPERAAAIDFSEPYAQTGLCLLTGKDAPIERFEDLAEPRRKLAVKQGTTAHLYASERIPPENLLVFDQEEAAVLEVVQGKVDAFAYDQMSIYRHWQRNPETTRPLLEPFRAESWAVGVRKGNEALVEEVNVFLEEFRAAGGFDRLGQKYLGEEKKAFEQLGYPFLF